MLRVSDPAEPALGSPKRPLLCGLPSIKSGSAFEVSNCFRDSIPGLSGSPVNASDAPLPIRPHDSGPQWLVFPFVLDSFIPYHSLALNGASFTLIFTFVSHRRCSQIDGSRSGTCIQGRVAVKCVTQGEPPSGTQNPLQLGQCRPSLLRFHPLDIHDFPTNRG